MTALDQAFIKAFSRQAPLPLALSPRPAAPASDQQASKREEPPKKKEMVRGQRPVISEEALSADQSVVMGPTLSECCFTGESIDTFVQSPLPTVDEIWTALEKTPKPAVAPVKVAEAKHEWPVISAPASVVDEPPISKSPSFPISESILPISPSPISLPLPPREFKPAWQLDHFAWPKLCRRLIDRANGELDRLADAIQMAGRQGKKVMAMGSCHRSEGATTLLLCAARRLAERGIKVAVIDADLGRPRVAKRLGVEAQCGWDETTENESLDQAIVEATADNVAIVPVREPPAESGREAGDPSRLADCLKVLQEHYDMVLVDVGPMENGGLFNTAWGRAAAEWINAVVVVLNPCVTSDEEQQSLEGKLAVAGVAIAGIVENFVTDD